MLIGDFGPDGKNGEMSLQALRNLGLGIKWKLSGPIPTKDGRNLDIRVKVRYYPNTRGAFK
jgi:hypothetical protein